MYDPPMIDMLLRTSRFNSRLGLLSVFMWMLSGQVVV